MRTRSSLVDDTAAELRQMIVGGQLQPGELLPPQRELAVRFGVGASTLREAVQTLIAVGLLQSHPGKGTWVREDSGAGLIHPEAVKARLGELNARSLAEARSVVEVALTELAATRATEEDLTRIRAAMTAMRKTWPTCRPLSGPTSSFTSPSPTRATTSYWRSSITSHATFLKK